ncbi:MAG: NAD(P)-binding protein, partial [SAR202 cluster bacterium]|nr:NAD(P)-binding protein [SAR202 cluster bacterium]
MANSKTAVIIGAGPAGLTAAHELLKNTNIHPVIYEATNDIGGIAMTAVYKGNRIDMGGHRFFSKSDRVMNWWFDFMPIEAQNPSPNGTVQVSYQNKTTDVDAPTGGPDPDDTDLVMLVRSRLSRIYYNRRFFDYPVSLNARTIKNLGLFRMARIGTSFMMAQARQIRPEKNLEDFFINRFGRELYSTFCRDYTDKGWGVPCTEISPEWGAQRIKGLSLTKALLHAVKSAGSRDGSVDQKGTETSLIERFLYPKFGPGQLWEEVARQVTDRGAELHCGQRVVG